MPTCRLPGLVAILGAGIALQVALFLTSTPEVAPTAAPPRLLPLSFADPACAISQRLARAASDPNPWAYHPDDNGEQRRCVSEPLALGPEPFVLLQYAGDPTRPGVRIDIVAVDDVRVAIPARLPVAARHGYLLATVPLPPALRSRAARLVLDDQSAERFGWLAIRNAAQVSAPWPEPLPPLLGPRALVAAVVLLAFAALLAMTQRRYRIAWLALAALTGLMFLRFYNFYQWDEYSLLQVFAADLSFATRVNYDDQLAPLFLLVFDLGTRLARHHYAPLQLVMLLCHLGVVLLLLSTLRRHGIGRLAATASALLYATAWVHADVVPWYMELSFLASSALTLLAVRQTVLAVQGAPHAPLASVVAAAAAGLVFIGGSVAPWLCAAYLTLHGVGRRRLRWWHLGFGLSIPALALAAGRGDVGAGLPTDLAGLGRALDYLLTGVVAGSALPFLRLDGRPVFATVAASLVAAALLAGWRRRLLGAWHWRSLAFGVAWLVAAYLLQAIGRAHLGSAQAASMRYSYLGMLGAAWLAATLLQTALEAVRRQRRHLLSFVAAACVWLLALAGVGAGAARYLRRVDAHEREYAQINRDQFFLTRAALEAGRAGGDLTLADTPLPRSLSPKLTRRDYVGLLPYLAGDPTLSQVTVRFVESQHAASGWQVFLAP
ncbi:MAG: hypothetical protein HY903_06295 [Deltaproteobacteria bacterium]|nr:hypothetical protein [Deltaproteobacteria bacterium]